jgi:hypothetical protein
MVFFSNRMNKNPTNPLRVVFCTYSKEDFDCYRQRMSVFFPLEGQAGLEPLGSAAQMRPQQQPSTPPSEVMNVEWHFQHAKNPHESVGPVDELVCDIGGRRCCGMMPRCS